MKTTKHTCGGPVFGRLAPRGQCKRCDELLFGMPAVKWNSSRRDHDARQVAANRAHFASDHHRSGKCGPVCTFGDW